MDTLKQTEAIPAAYPALVLPKFYQHLEAGFADWVWQRIEAYIAYRWTDRQVIWIVEGPGEWEPPLAPATITAVELFNAGTWEAVTLSPTALGGYYVPGAASFRFTADVGGGDVPEMVHRAAERYAIYCIGSASPEAGPMFWATSVNIQKGSGDSLAFDRQANWIARAMQNSGAGDLLRNYRRV